MRVYTAQMALLAKPTLGMLPGPDQMQKDRPQFTQVRPRTVIERATSLGSWLPHNRAKPRDLTLRLWPCMACARCHAYRMCAAGHAHAATGTAAPIAGRWRRGNIVLALLHTTVGMHLCCAEADVSRRVSGRDGNPLG